jgi:hypothetical protein
MDFPDLPFSLDLSMVALGDGGLDVSERQSE